MTETDEPDGQPKSSEHEDPTVPAPVEHRDSGHDEERYEPEDPTPDQISDPARRGADAASGEQN